MSAAVAPKAPEPPEPAGADDEGWALLENLRRRLEDQAAQTRRTQQQVSQLAESIGALVEAQQRRSRWLNLNSFVAYLIFTMLCGAGFYFLYQTRAGMLADARDAAQRDRDQAVRKSDEAAAQAAARERADAGAWEVYQLLEAGKRTEAEQKLAALGDLPLSRTERTILAARAHETQVMAVEAALKAAAASLKAGRHAEVIAPLEAALVSEPAGARAALARYYLGVAYAKGNQLAKAVAHLQAAVDGGAEPDDARFQLASALDRGGAFARARAEYDRFATAHPQSPLAVFAMRRSATLARMPPVAPWSVVGKGAGAAAAAGPAAPGAPGAAPPAPGAPGAATPAPAMPGAAAAPGATGAPPAASPAAPAGGAPRPAPPTASPAAPAGGAPRVAPPAAPPGAAPRLAPAPRPAVQAPRPAPAGAGAGAPQPGPAAPAPAPAQPPAAPPAQPSPPAASTPPASAAPAAPAPAAAP